MLPKGKLSVIIDGQWGSTGKGKLAGWIGRRWHPDVVICDFSSNAGHTFVDDDGTPTVLRQLPTAGVVNEKAVIVLTAGCVIRPPVLLDEIRRHKVAPRIIVHPHAAVIEDSHQVWEEDNMPRISSTCEGCGAAACQKIARELGPGSNLAENCSALSPFVGNAESVIHGALDAGKRVLMETSQGFDLSLNHGHHYPFVTGRDITVAGALSNACVAPADVGLVIGSLRSLPIRVGHALNNDGVLIGDSGPCWPDQREMTWPEVTTACGSPNSLREETTVTKKPRRIFSWSPMQVARFIRANKPDLLFISFMDYVDWGCHGGGDFALLGDKVHVWLERTRGGLMGALTSVPPFALLGTGPRDSDMVDCA